jgi:hypothetical protein
MVNRLIISRIAAHCLVAAVSFGWLTGAQAEDAGKTIMGFVERVAISDTGFSVKARLDTGAQTSSLDAHNIQRFRRGERRYVRFDVLEPETNDLVTLERPLVRIVRIRQHSGEPMQRPVVKMSVCIGDLMRRIEVNLTPRSEFIYPMLIGRSAMRGAIVVDPELTFTNPPSCEPAEYEE